MVHNAGDWPVGLLVVVEAVLADCDELSFLPSGNSKVWKNITKFLLAISALIGITYMLSK